MWLLATLLCAEVWGNKALQGGMHVLLFRKFEHHMSISTTLEIMIGDCDYHEWPCFINNIIINVDSDCTVPLC